MSTCLTDYRIAQTMGQWVWNKYCSNRMVPQHTWWEHSCKWFVKYLPNTSSPILVTPLGCLTPQNSLLVIIFCGGIIRLWCTKTMSNRQEITAVEKKCWEEQCRISRSCTNVYRKKGITSFYSFQSVYSLYVTTLCYQKIVFNGRWACHI